MDQILRRIYDTTEKEINKLRLPSNLSPEDIIKYLDSDDDENKEVSLKIFEIETKIKTMEKGNDKRKGAEVTRLEKTLKQWEAYQAVREEASEENIKAYQDSILADGEDSWRDAKEMWKTNSPDLVIAIIETKVEEGNGDVPLVDSNDDVFNYTNLQQIVQVYSR